MVRHALETWGHQAVLAADADTALERLAALPIDVVLLDVMMPVRDGWTVLEALGAPSRPPVIVLSGRAGTADLKRAQRRGAVDALAAPYTPQELNQAVASALVGRDVS